MNSYQAFLKLHQDTTPLLLGNAWDVTSAKILEQNGIKAIGTSSWAVAQSMGFEDGENIPFDLLFQIAKRISQSIKVPFSVDIEGGYSRNSNEIAQNIERLHDIGVVGINLEDSANRQLLPVEVFQKTLSDVANLLAKKNIRIFINARTDAFLLKHPSPLDETLKRIKAYENNGATGIFAPYALDKSDISKIVGSTSLPVNVLCNVALPAFAELKELGVKRISMGSGLFNAINSSMKKLVESVDSDQACQALFR